VEITVALVGLIVVLGLMQAGPGMREKVALAGLGLTGILSLAMGVLPNPGSPYGYGPVGLFVAVLAFSALAWFTLYRPPR